MSNLSITINAETAAELQVLVANLAETMGVQSLPVNNTPSARVAAKVAEQNQEAATSEDPTPAKPAPRARAAAKPKAAPVVAPAETPAAPAEGKRVAAFMRSDKADVNKPYEVYKADGSLFSAFADSSKAFDRLLKEIEAAESLDDLNSLTSHNTGLVEQLEAGQQDEYAEKVDDQYAALQNAEEAPVEATIDQVEAAMQAAVKAHGLVPVKEFMDKNIGTYRLKDIKPEQYSDVVVKLAGMKKK